MTSRVAVSFTLLVLIAVLILTQRTVSNLTGAVEASCTRIAQLEQSLLEERAKIAVLNKFVMTNHETIRGMQRRKVLTVTAYSPRPEETNEDPFTTASNRPVRPGIVAVSRDLFDEGWVFGRKVYIKGMGVFTIDDLMHARKRNQVDIFMFETAKARDFGLQKLEVYLLDT
ncbi:3D domain-containing protein [Desulfocurvibacter africanus]|uniref:3D domain-containing protein n=1 Tax=Desulfocurvibacter africanus subsp. africanus str. Walvis Bay TaxID=690850 RepID=F3YUA8_DESAF|nr:3D domain-containing protein [Desulfocurvibacter africanus]EGJ48714.1 hypothetical protein Desaf_0358 [Desulfocurvibacter africanus subsp. africanus str. Walvis Bay]